MSRTRVVHVNDNVPGAIYIGRAVPRRGLKASIWANPYAIGRSGTRAQVIARYANDLHDRLATSARQDILDDLYELIGKPLACWCRHDGEERTAANWCHGDVLVELLRELRWDDADEV